MGELQNASSPSATFGAAEGPVRARQDRPGGLPGRGSRPQSAEAPPVVMSRSRRFPVAPLQLTDERQRCLSIIFRPKAIRKPRRVSWASFKTRPPPPRRPAPRATPGPRPGAAQAPSGRAKTVRAAFRDADRARSAEAPPVVMSRSRRFPVAPLQLTDERQRCLSIIFRPKAIHKPRRVSWASFKTRPLPPRCSAARETPGSRPDAPVPRKRPPERLSRAKP